jgi:hypothetical protein
MQVTRLCLRGPNGLREFITARKHRSAHRKEYNVLDPLVYRSLHKLINGRGIAKLRRPHDKHPFNSVQGEQGGGGR